MSTLKYKITDKLNKLCGYPECPVVNRKKFDVIIGDCTVDESFAAAKTLGGELSYPETLEEMQAVQKMVMERYSFHDTTFWLAFTDCNHEGTWVFDKPTVEGVYDACYGPYTEVPYELPWIEGEPNNSGAHEHWCEIYSLTGLLNDRHYDAMDGHQLPLGFIIQYPAA